MIPQENIARGCWILMLMSFSAFVTSTYGDCGAPERLDYATLDSQFSGQSTFVVGAVVTYACLPGYIRVQGAANSSTCLSNSTWSIPVKFCQLRSCGNPGEIENGEMHLDSTLFGSRVNYTCNIGYRMISKFNYRECQADGSWSNAAPACEVQICAPPEPIGNGSHDPIKDEYRYQDSVTYHCTDKTFALVGSSSAFCTAFGNWSSDPPKCVSVECSNPVVANAIKLSGLVGPYYYDNAISFQCSAGFTMKGASVVKCNVSSQWDPPLPTCSPVECPSPDVANAVKSGSTGPYYVNSAVTFECSPGFTMNGANLVKCKANSQWDPPLPKCDQNSVAAVFGNSIIILTTILLGHVISHHI